MKKPKRSLDWEGQEVDESEDSGLGLDWEEAEIIDLEEVVELAPAGPEDDDRQELDEEILDAESDLDIAELDLDFDAPDRTRAQRDLLDTLREIPESADLDGIGEPVETLDAGFVEEVEDGGRTPVDDEDDIFTQFEKIKEAMSGDRPVAVGPAVGSGVADLRPAPTASESFGAETAEVEPVTILPEASATVVGPEAGAPEVVGPEVSEPVTVEAVEEAVARMEERLLQTIHRIVETKLPEIVRQVLKEEIDRMQRESISS